MRGHSGPFAGNGSLHGLDRCPLVIGEVGDDALPVALSGPLAKSPALGRSAAACCPVATGAGAAELERLRDPDGVETCDTPVPGMPTVVVRRPELWTEYRAPLPPADMPTPDLLTESRTPARS